ncbi:uncharacterized protein THITE_2090789 [Thermothielavioides terrestris NRRL 8126]|uniref:Uncharacterized protein n=1 Tax=Thermothielavioides terrestris (strain ATCC 38088 / NRRL 8126) TaxID=578455 RepID=G2RBX0_THETT|nr:uncharacterized protein THITE_2090789 [Thermothielavioides terrestris NRRL 8126]AEO69291.1 hypothetical protein THITE_2090789 [Thermothielavioides terrestris NRRL 8126]
MDDPLDNRVNDPGCVVRKPGTRVGEDDCDGQRRGPSVPTTVTILTPARPTVFRASRRIAGIGEMGKRREPGTNRICSPQAPLSPSPLLGRIFGLSCSIYRPSSDLEEPANLPRAGHLLSVVGWCALDSPPPPRYSPHPQERRWGLQRQEQHGETAT